MLYESNMQLNVHLNPVPPTSFRNLLYGVLVQQERRNTNRSKLTTAKITRNYDNGFTLNVFFYSHFKAKSVICTCMQKKSNKKNNFVGSITHFIFIMIAVSRK